MAKREFTPDERRDLIGGRELGFTWDEIAILLDRSSGHTCRMQHVKITTPHPYTKSEIHFIHRLREVPLSWGEIALHVGHKSGTGIRIKLWHMRQAHRRRQRKTRPCMTCRAPFFSDGPHNRMCDACRAGADTVSPYEPDGGVADFDALAAS